MNPSVPLPGQDPRVVRRLLPTVFGRRAGFSVWLWAYFHSGWAFLIPYLFTYLIFAWRGWPANPAFDLQAGNGRTPNNVFWIPIPPLLYVYWTLHLAHFGLAIVAFRSWWKCTSHLLSTGHRAALPRSYMSITMLRSVTPWAFLALIFAIPGIYLEWPSDPWEHLRRITEWKSHAVVGGHSAGYKSFYFFAYSWVGWLSPSRLLSWLEGYYVAICLLLSWQYYLLAKAVGLDRRWAFLFVVINALTFGNNVFSFYRYYGLASTVFAHLGAIALTRITLDYANIIGHGSEVPLMVADGPTADADSPAQPSVSVWTQLSYFRHFRSLFTANRVEVHSGQAPVQRLSTTATGNRAATLQASSVYRQPRTACGLLLSAALLLTLIVFNHVQGIGIAGLGIGAIFIWRLIDWRRAMIGWLALAALVLSMATILYFPRHPALDDIYRPGGWLTAWYGFNLFSPASPAFERSLHILGTFGVIELILALWLIARLNHVVGWLTLTPVIALVTPCFAVPFSDLVAAKTSIDNIVIFHRMLLAVPLGLALVTVAGGYSSPGKQRAAAINRPIFSLGQVPSHFISKVRSLGAAHHSAVIFFVTMLGLAIFTASSPGANCYSRLWHGLFVPATDQELQDVMAGGFAQQTQLSEQSERIITSQAGAGLFALYPTAPGLLELSAWQRLQASPLPALSLVVALLRENELPHSNLRLPLPIDRDRWIHLGGTPPLLISQPARARNIPAFQNQPGAAANIFSAAQIPLEANLSYVLEFTVRRQTTDSAPAYLAVAWYDSRGNLLTANEPAPHGAGNPRGWSNGTYSYFGLVGQVPPRDWAAFRVRFGSRERASIPPHAATARFGVLLNPSGLPGAALQFAGGNLSTVPVPAITFFAPAPRALFTPISLAGFISGHWLPQKIAIDRAGTDEVWRIASLKSGFELQRVAPGAKSH